MRALSIRCHGGRDPILDFAFAIEPVARRSARRRADELDAGTIGRLSEIATTIASAIEEQGAATQEITRNVQQAAAGTTQVASNITDVSRGASETGSGSSQVLSSAQSLANESNESNRLKLEMGKFLTTVRAA
jgi:methyl-accepting chemotaxis protein